ncbi:MAG: hypothetical protein SFY81_00350 [Verrucomicrobiota bacterium]|nr:hypothetical protein [Verrucomicrobiota bacterium]
MAKGEISWKTKVEGVRREVYAHHVGNRWVFFVRERKFDEWQKLDNPPIEDWMELLDGVKRRIARRLLRPEEEVRVKELILERFPEASL